tara:strand:+ start:295 stop:552 length:258 start_codon:yes stop_codon:yes gene_type:complete
MAVARAHAMICGQGTAAQTRQTRTLTPAFSKVSTALITDILIQMERLRLGECFQERVRAVDVTAATPMAKELAVTPPIQLKLNVI